MSCLTCYTEDMEKGKYFIKLVISHFLFYTGIIHLIKCIMLRRKAVVLMYHRVLPNDVRINTFSHDGIIVNVDTFETHIQYLNKIFNVVTLQEFTEKFIKGASYDKPVCLITFDDGWKDNYIYAYPILKKYDTPAIVFLPANYIDTDNTFWQEGLNRMLIDIYYMGKKGEKYYDRFFKLLNKYDLQYIMNLSEDRLRSSIAEAVNRKKKMLYDEVERMMEDISNNTESLTNGRENCDTFLRWEEIMQMKKDRISFGSHGMNHKILTNLTLSEAEKEIAESKRNIEDNLKDAVIAFSYPNGNYNKDIIELVKSHGYAVAFSTENGHVSASDDPFTVKRINIHNDVTKNIPMFLSTILGIF